MKRTRFRHLAACCGSDLERWPAAEREAARTLIVTDPEARLCLTEAHEIDAVLDAAQPPIDLPVVERVFAAIMARVDHCAPDDRRSLECGEGLDGPASPYGPAGLRSAGHFVPPAPTFPLTPPPSRPSPTQPRLPPQLPLLHMAGFLAAMAVAGFLVGDLGLFWSPGLSQPEITAPDITALVQTGRLGSLY